MSISKYLKNIFFTIILILFSIFLLFAVKGDTSETGIKFQSSYDRVTSGPFESSGSTSRYALTQAIVENKTLFLNSAQTEFAAPDVADYNGKYFSIFTPGVSVLGIPFYLAGKLFGMPQLFAYLINIIFAFFDLLLVMVLAKKVGVNKYTALASGAVFVFATNLISYAGTYTQHIASSFIILLCILNSIGDRTLVKNIILGILIGIGVLLDIPNLFLILPIILYVFAKHIFFVSDKHETKINFSLIFFGIFVGLIPLIIFFGWYNYKTAGSPLMLAQFVGRSRIYAQQDTPTIKEDGLKINTPFRTRNQLLGSYILTVSNERGVFYYSPVLLLGLIGFYLIYKKGKEKKLSYLLFSVVLINLVVYSMFSDYHGGWAFGSRYMIPAQAMLSVGVAFFLEYYMKSLKIMIFTFILAVYSIFVGTLGAMTTTNIPPKAEAIYLPAPVTYTYKYNLNLVEKGNIGSLAYNMFFKKNISGTVFVSIYVGTLVLLISVLQIMAIKDKRKYYPQRIDD